MSFSSVFLLFKLDFHIEKLNQENSVLKKTTQWVTQTHENKRKGKNSFVLKKMRECNSQKEKHFVDKVL